MAYRFNIFTGTLDIAGGSNPGPSIESEIVTHELNAAGNLLVIYDINSLQHIAMGPLPVVDNNGDVVKA